MMKLRRNIKGETLAETIIALSILAIGVTVSSTIVLNSLRNLSNAKSRVVAVNIAREGIEAMRNVRDSNWLFYSDKRRTCWNHDTSTGTCTDGSSPIAPGTYIVYKDTNNSWKLVNVDSDVANDADLDGIDNNDISDTATIRLALVDIDAAVDSDNADGDDDVNTGADDDLDMYNHKHAVATNSLGLEQRTTPFNRYITIEYLENEPGANSQIDPSATSINSNNEWTNVAVDPTELNRMRITSTVEWTRGSATHFTSLSTIISDHLGRRELDS